MDIEELIDTYDYWLEFGKSAYTAKYWISLSLAIAFFVGIGSFFILSILLNQVTILPIAIPLAILVLLLGYPYMKKESIIDSIEENFSDALKQMADILKAGDTYESALREVVNADYGRLSEEMNIALRRLEEGENINTALNGLSERIDSKLVKRTIVILLDSIKTGSSLADILEDIADDVREMHRLKKSRKANTTMQFMFMLAAGGFIAPMIFGEVSAVLSIFGKVTIGAIENVQEVAAQSSNFITLLIQAYILISVIGTGIMMSLIREGKVNKSIIYIPVLLLIAYTMYYVSTAILGIVLGGAF
jgi:flagellar protein FlaJ